jgi:hypothetical protein
MQADRSFMKYKFLSFTFATIIPEDGVVSVKNIRALLHGRTTLEYKDFV